MLGATALAIWAIFIERFLFVIRKDSIAALPKGSRPIRILQIGDIHLAPWQRRKMRFLSSLAKLEIDLVVNTGDNLGHERAIEPLLASLSGLLKKPGVFVHGSNDYYAPVFKNPVGYIFHSSTKPTSKRLDTEKLTLGFEDAGWINLNNATKDVSVSGTSILFHGLDDFHIGLHNSSKLKPDTSFSIGVTHAPYLEALKMLSDAGAQIVFAGHTHGGQVRLPLIGAITTNSDLPNRYARGTSKLLVKGKEIFLSVVAGLGNSIYAPIRFLCRPEVRLITLVATD